LNDQITIFVAFLAGTFSFLSPCVLPLFPSYLSFITGMSFEEIASTESRSLKPVVKNSLLFIAGFSLVFISMGASAGFLGGLLFNYRNIMQLLGGILVIFFGLYIMGILKLTLLGRYIQLDFRNRPAGVFGSLLIGAAFAIGWTPCVGPILGSILALAASAGKADTGVWLLSSYSVGLGVPFFLSSIAIHRFSPLLQRFRRGIQIVHIGAGLLLVAAGILLVTGYMAVLNQYAIKLTPAWLWSRL
jgi:cytochrome c-type biogenesis protein